MWSESFSVGKKFLPSVNDEKGGGLGPMAWGVLLGHVFVINERGKKNQRGSPAGGDVARSGGNLATLGPAGLYGFWSKKTPEPAARRKHQTTTLRVVFLSGWKTLGTADGVGF